MPDETIAYGIFERAEGKELFVGCWTTRDALEGNIEHSNCFPRVEDAEAAMAAL